MPKSCSFENLEMRRIQRWRKENKEKKFAKDEPDIKQKLEYGILTKFNAEINMVGNL